MLRVALCGGRGHERRHRVAPSIGTLRTDALRRGDFDRPLAPGRERFPWTRGTSPGRRAVSRCAAGSPAVNEDLPLCGRFSRDDYAAPAARPSPSRGRGLTGDSLPTKTRACPGFPDAGRARGLIADSGNPYGQGPHALSTASRSRTSTMPSPLTSAEPEPPHFDRTSSRSSTSTTASPVTSAGQDGAPLPNT